jgi:class 3 adenylate cyclase
MPREALNLAILFADVAKSTQLYEKMGNKFAQAVIGQCITVFAKITNHYNGTVIKTIGDEIMCTFPSAKEAVQAGIDMNQALDDMAFPQQPGFKPPNISVGLTYGPVIREDDDVFGDAVNLAARMVALANQRQILTTQDTIDSFPEDYNPSVQLIDQTTIKGKSGAMKVFEIVWEQHDVTVMMEDPLDTLTLRSRMELTLRSQAINVDHERPSVTLGRQSHNDLVVENSRVSRSHARIEYRRGKFILIDQSSNGTYYQIQDKNVGHLKRDEAPLHGSGCIYLGQEMSPDAPDAVHFKITM